MKTGQKRCIEIATTKLYDMRSREKIVDKKIVWPHGIDSLVDVLLDQTRVNSTSMLWWEQVLVYFLI